MLLSRPLERLAAFEPSPFPVISLYLNTQPNQHGRDDFDRFLKKELAGRLKSYRAGSAERESLEADVARIQKYVAEELQKSANGLALFASHGSDLFEAVQLTAPIDEHWVHIGDQPHLYPLARLNDQYPRFAVVVTDTNRGRIFAAGGGEIEAEREVTNAKTRRTSMGGWSQARYQRHVENFHLHHVKELVDVLDQIVSREKIQRVILAGDEVVMPLVQEQLPPRLAELVVEVVRLDINAPKHEVLEAALDTVRREDLKSDREKAEAAIGAWRASGLGVVGLRDTRAALEKGQVDELLIASSPENLALDERPTELVSQDRAAPADEALAARDPKAAAADQLVTLAQQTNARVTFIEDPGLLAEVGGVGGLLRFKA